MAARVGSKELGQSGASGRQAGSATTVASYSALDDTVPVLGPLEPATCD